jgi:hypothetical protein
MRISFNVHPASMNAKRASTFSRMLLIKREKPMVTEAG